MNNDENRQDDPHFTLMPLSFRGVLILQVFIYLPKGKTVNKINKLLCSKVDGIMAREK